MSHSLGIIFPTYNPKNDWDKQLLLNIQTLQSQIPADIHFMVIDDGSDNAEISPILENIAQSISGFRYYQLPQNQGKGAALRAGVELLNCDYYLYTDIDSPFTIDSVLNVYATLLLGNDVVCGDRGGAYIRYLPLKRRVTSHVARWLNRYVLGIKNYDSQGGLKGFNRKGKEVFLRTRINRFLFDTEFIFLAERNPEIKLYTVPINIREGVYFSNFGLKVLFVEFLNFLLIRFRA